MPRFHRQGRTNRGPKSRGGNGSVPEVVIVVVVVVVVVVVLLLLVVSLQVVPHKAVAEVSRIGNV